MFLPNLYLFRFTKPFDITAEDLAEKLANEPFRVPGPQEMGRFGFVAPELMPEDMLVRAVDGRLQFTLRIDKKDIPSSIVKQMVQERVEAIAEEQDRKVRKKEKDEIKEQVLLELLPKAFVKTSFSTGYIDVENQLLVIGEGSAKKAENLASTLRKAIGSLPVRPIAYEMAPTFKMTAMVQGNEDFTNSFQPGQNITLKDPAETKTKVTCNNIDVFCDEVQSHLNQGMQVSNIDLNWDDLIRFKTDFSAFKGIKFDEDLVSQLDEIDSDDRLARYDAMFSMFVEQVTDMIKDYIELMGGEDTSAILEE